MARHPVGGPSNQSKDKLCVSVPYVRQFISDGRAIAQKILVFTDTIIKIPLTYLYTKAIYCSIYKTWLELGV